MKKTILIAAVMFFAFSVAASAQALFQVGSTPVISVASCGTTELTGDIAFTQVAGSPPVQTGTITINYGVPISVPNLAVQGGATLTVKDSTGTVLSTTNITSANVTGNLLTLQIFPPASGAAPYTFIVHGVRVNVAGNPGLTSLSAVVASTINLFVGGQTNVMVIASIAPAISGIDTLQGLPPVSSALFINAVSTAGLGTVNLDVVEGFANAFVPGEIIGLTFSAIPAGLSVDTFPLTITTASGTVFTLSDATGTALAASPVLTSTSANLIVYYKVTALGATSVVDVETFRIPIVVGLTVVPAPPSPLPQGSVTVTADVYPKLGVFPDFAGSTIPQYSGTSCQKGPVTILTILTANTNLLIPFAVFDGTFDTGIAIANTTTDPFALGAVKQTGTLTFNFFPQTGASFTYTTDANSPNPTTLNAGKLESGRLYSLLLSQLLAKATGAPATFTGYIIVTCNFTNAHGQYFVSDFEAFTNGALMLVLDPRNRNNAPENLNN